MATTGYKNIDLPNDKHDIIVDDYFSKVVIKIFEWYETQGFSMDLIRQKLKNDFGINWAKATVDNILKNPFYYGEMLWKGKLYPHKYPPLITKGLFDQVQQIKLGFHKKPFKYAGKPYVYRGMIRCAYCGLSITPEMKKGHVYYHCTQYNGKHGAEWLREDTITEQLGDIFKRLQVPESVLGQIVEALKENHENKANFREEQYKQISQEREVYAKRQEKIYLDKLDGKITDDEYEKYSQSFREKISEMDAQLSILQEAEDNYYITTKYVLELASRAYELFKSSEVEERRQLIKLVLSNLRMENKNLVFEAKKPFDTILKYADSQLWLPSSKDIIVALDRINKAFNNVMDMEVVKNRWSEIKRIQTIVSV